MFWSGADLQEVCVSYGTFSALVGSNEKANGRVVKMWATSTLEKLCSQLQACLDSNEMDVIAVRLSELEQVFDSMKLGRRPDTVESARPLLSGENSRRCV